MSKNAIIGLVIGIIIIGGGAWWFMGQNSGQPAVNQPNTNQQPSANTPTNNNPTGENVNTQPTNEAPDGNLNANVNANVNLNINQPSDDIPKVKSFSVTAANFSFSVKDIRAKIGDTVRVTVTNEEGTHNWMLSEFNAGTNLLQAGQQQTIEFVANKKGTVE